MKMKRVEMKRFGGTWGAPLDSGDMEVWRDTKKPTILMGAKRLQAELLAHSMADIAREQHRADEVAWITSREEGHFSFLGICESLGLPADALREHMLALPIATRRKKLVSTSHRCHNSRMIGADYRIRRGRAA